MKRNVHTCRLASELKPVLYLEQAQGPLLARLSVVHNGHNVWVILCEPSHPAGDL